MPRRSPPLARRDPGARRRRRARPRLRHRARRRRRRGAAQARRLSLRAEGIADPRRAACAWRQPGRRAAATRCSSRSPACRAAAAPGTQSLLRALAADLELGASTRSMLRPRRAVDRARRPAPSSALERCGRGARAGDTVERLEALALRAWSRATRSPAAANSALARPRRARLDRDRAVCLCRRSPRCGPAEIAGLLAGLDGRFVAPGPSGAPTPRAARRVADRAQFLLGRYPRRADPGRLAARLAVGRPARSSAMPRSTATGRRASRCRPGARRTCAPAATTSPRRWR